MEEEVEEQSWIFLDFVVKTRIYQNSLWLILTLLSLFDYSLVNYFTFLQRNNKITP